MLAERPEVSAARSPGDILGDASEALLRRLLPGEEVGEQSRRFLEGLGWIGFFFFLARGLSFLVQLLAGRWLGPEEFGTANLIQAAALLLVIPLQLGFPAALERLPGRLDAGPKREGLVWGLLALSVTWCGLAAFGLAALRGPLGRLLRVSPSLYAWSAAFAVLSALLNLCQSALQGTQRFAGLGKMQGAYGSLLAALFFLFWFWLGGRFQSYVLAYLGAMAGGVLLAAVYLAPASSSRWSLPQASAMGSYLLAPSLQTVLACVASAAVPLLLAGYSGAWGVGVFSAYSLGSIAVSQVLALGILSAVLVPLASGQGRFPGAWRRFRTISAPALAVAFPAFSVVTAAVMPLVGSRYPLRWDWVLLFAGAASVGFLYWVARALLSAHGARGLWLATLAAGVEMAGTLGIVVLFGPRYGLSAVAWALLVGYAAALAWCVGWGESLRHA